MRRPAVSVWEVEQMDKQERDIIAMAEGDFVADTVEEIEGMVKELAHQVDFDATSGLASRWYPLGSKRPVVLDPLVSFGRPSIVGKGVTTANVYDLFIAENENVKQVCSWMRLTPNEAKAAIEFEKALAA